MFKVTSHCYDVFCYSLLSLNPGADPGFWNGSIGRASSGWAWGGDDLLPNVVGSAEIPRIFLTFWLGMVHFNVSSDKNSQFTGPIAG